MFDYSWLLEKEATPFYVYDLDGLKTRADFFHKSMPPNGRAFFALKANNNRECLQTLLRSGYGADVVSMGEMNLALDLGFRPEQIIFSGIGKTIEEINAAVAAGICQINVESSPELERIAQCALKLRKKAAIALRMNPDVEVNTHPYIRTGFRENKFGFDFSEIPRLLEIIKKNAGSLELKGLTVHIGSQIRDVSVIVSAVTKTLELFKNVQANGFSLSTFDVGGGLGIDYTDGDLRGDENLISSYMNFLKPIASQVERILFEPGRIISARFGALLTEIQYVKQTPYKNFLVVDTGMHHLLRPALYQAHHRIEPIFENEGSKNILEEGPKDIFDIVGPICESSDTLGAKRELPASLKSGDILIIHDVGAYGAVMTSDYNLRPRAREICLARGKK